MSLIGYSSAQSNPALDTDLGLEMVPAGQQHVVIPKKNAINTINTIVTGSGYTLGSGGSQEEGIVCTATGGSGTGAKFIVQSIPALGAIKTGTTIPLTAGFSNFQGTLVKNYDVASSNYTYVRDTATGTNIVSGTTTAIVGTSAGGAAATFLVTVSNGTITNVQQSGVLGTGYKVGDVITITIADLQAPMNVVNGGGGTVILRDLKLLLTEDDVTGGLFTAQSTVTVVNGGSGYTVADVLTLQEEGSTSTGTGTLVVATLDSALSVGQPILRYPQGVMLGVSGFTGATPGTTGIITLKQMDGSNVTIGGLTTGRILPMQFLEIAAAGTTIEMEFVTIYY